MKERPILFSAPMVRAILEGRTTQTRRIIKSPSVLHPEFVLLAHDDVNHAWWPFQSDDGDSSVTSDGMEEPIECPYGQPGDRLWVRETWRADRCYDHLAPRDIPVNTPIFYDENGNIVNGYHKRRPGMFMMRRMSRITLEVTGVRCERLQEISETDAIKEGFSPVVAGFSGKGGWARDRFCDLWDKINAKRAPWVSNPWVWVIQFKALDKVGKVGI